MDAWWESLDKAFGAWTQAIEESGLDWKYRQVEAGEWDLFSPKEGAIGEVIDSTSHRMPDITQALPWDHLDTGIDKRWLYDDLNRALEAATIPDCSFDGCSHCGVCGVDFGHNVVVPALPIPPFDGQFKPKSDRIQRFRLRFAKYGDMALVSHLDLLRLFDRVVRRAGLPISFTNGFHPSPRIIPASALSLGITSDGEIMDFELTERMNLEDFQTRLAAHLPKDLPVVSVEELPIKALAATASLEQAEYRLNIQLSEDPENTQNPAVTLETVQSWVNEVLSQDEILVEHKTKSGKLKDVNVRSRLFDLAVEEVEGDSIAAQITVRYVGSCQNNGTLLRPDEVVKMLEGVSSRSLILQHIHRMRLILASPETPT